jgi:AcrR family transcriptional regulator
MLSYDDAREILRPALATIGRGGEDTSEGRRERKKRELRQQISDTATRMFLDRGFNAVTVREIAESCDVSEKTVFNYFPTKESLLLDREEYETALLTEALRDKGDGRSLVDSVLLHFEADHTFWTEEWRQHAQPEEVLGFLARFGEVVDGTPSLAAAKVALAERMTQVAARALAERAGVSPDDPEPQMAAAIVLQLSSRRLRARQLAAEETRSFDEMRTFVIEDLRRAARVADTGLASFDLVVGPRRGREQLREAAEATNEARKQIVAAVRKARDAWKQVVKEAKAHHDAYHEAAHGTQRERQAAQRERQAARRERQAEMHERHQEAHAARQARQAEKRQKRPR